MSELKVGDHVTYWRSYRANGKVGGWARHTVTGLLMLLNRTTAWIVPDDWHTAEKVPLARIRRQVHHEG
jgi:hypothetical protein